MISAFTNIFKIPELRQRILFTVAMLVIVRAGAAITIPGVNAHVLNEWFQTSMSKSAGGGVAALFNIFAGGALEHCAIFSLGIMPYISASIMMQLLTAVIPRLNKLAREDGGRQKITQYTRYVTLALCIFQGYLLAVSMQNPSSNPFLQGIEAVTARLGPLVQDPGLGFQIVATIDLKRGNNVSDVGGRSDYRAWDRQWNVVDYHGRDCGVAAWRVGAGVEHLRADRRRTEPG